MNIPSPAAVRDRETEIKARIIAECLSSHDVWLDREEMIIDVAYHILESVDSGYCMLFAVLTNVEFGPGKYALTHNEHVDDAIVHEDWKLLVRIARMGIDSFPEVFKNHNITAEELKVVHDAIDLEMKIMESIVANYHPDIYTYDRSIIPHKQLAGETRQTTFYDLCREIICSTSNMSPVRVHVCSEIYLIDMVEGECVPRTYCLNLNRVLLDAAVAHGDEVVNYMSGHYFCQSTLDTIRKRYSKEIKIYRYWLYHSESLL
jgi:hypothetical protein